MLKRKSSLKAVTMIIPLIAGGSVLAAMADTAILLDQKPGDGRTQELQQQQEQQQYQRQQKREQERAIDVLREMLESVEFPDHKQPNIDKQIQEYMEQARLLRVEQVDLQAVLERANIDGDHIRTRDLQRALVDVEHQLQLKQLELERLMVAQSREEERRNLSTMSDRLDYVAGWRDVAFDPPQAVTMATQAIVEIHLGFDDAAGAVGELERLLANAKDLGSRTAIRFALKDLYVELDDAGQAAEQMLQVVLENSKWLEH